MTKERKQQLICELSEWMCNVTKNESEWVTENASLEDYVTWVRNRICSSDNNVSWWLQHGFTPEEMQELEIIYEDETIEIKNFEIYEKLTSCVDSMLFDSDTNIAMLEMQYNNYNIKISLEVKGETKISFDFEWYKTPSEFPEKLKQRIREGRLEPSDPFDEELFIDMNNWFEYMYSIDGYMVDGYVCETDISKLSPDELKAEMLEVAGWVIEGMY